jgi:hypothetical protein
MACHALARLPFSVQMKMPSSTFTFHRYPSRDRGLLQGMSCQLDSRMSLLIARNSADKTPPTASVKVTGAEDTDEWLLGSYVTVVYI